MDGSAPRPRPLTCPRPTCLLLDGHAALQAAGLRYHGDVVQSASGQAQECVLRGRALQRLVPLQTPLVPELQPKALRPAWARLPGKAQASGGPGGHRQAQDC